MPMPMSPEVGDIVKGTPVRAISGGVADERWARRRIDDLNKRGIDLQVVHINMFWWYAATDRDLAAHIVQTQDEGAFQVVRSIPGSAGGIHVAFAAISGPGGAASSSTP